MSRNSECHRPSREVPPGSTVEFCQEVATVVRDRGEDLIVDAGDGAIRWWWTFEGESVAVHRYATQHS